MTNISPWEQFIEILKLLGLAGFGLEFLKRILDRRAKRDAEDVQLAIKRIDASDELRGEMRQMWESCCAQLEACQIERDRYRTANALTASILENIFLRLATIAEYRANGKDGWEFGLTELERQAANGLPDIMAAVDAVRASERRSNEKRTPHCADGKDESKGE